MCGLTGFWQRGTLDRHAPDVLRRMTDVIRHRGPDDDGYWLDHEAGIALGHRRLAIIDLSPEGRQPMVSATKRYVIIFNGEIYNFEELRTELERLGAAFRGRSDTEVMLSAMEQWGLGSALQRFAGMFAFALWDTRERTLYLSRDRIGEKPLYYGWLGDTLVFGSELKALTRYPRWQRSIDRAAVGMYVRNNYIPAPHSIYHNIRKVLPGTILAFHDDPQRIPPVETRYWSATQAVAQGIRDPYREHDPIVDEFDRLLRRVVRREMVADVPLGAFLSGGIDSSTIVAVMQAESDRPVRSFTIGFPELEYNEAVHAKAVASHLGTEHTELYVTPKEMLEVVPQLPYLYDEPFGDSSQIPTFLVSKLTREFVTVSLSGDGGDELFGGYHRYGRARQLWNRLRHIPELIRQPATALARAWGLGAPEGSRRARLSHLLGCTRGEDFYRAYFSLCPAPERLAIGVDALAIPPSPDQWPETEDLLEHMMLVDLVSYLPDDIMVKVDRASMGVSLESRAPFLDHELVEFAWRVPLELKFRNGRGKWLVRQLLDRYVPRQLIDRPKKGFGVPLGTWLTGPLRDWAQGLFDPERLRQDEFLNPAGVSRIWNRYVERPGRGGELVWSLLMFQAWLETA